MAFELIAARQQLSIDLDAEAASILRAHAAETHLNATPPPSFPAVWRDPDDDYDLVALGPCITRTHSSPATTTSSHSIPTSATSSTSRSSPLANSSIASTEGGDADDHPQSIPNVGLSIVRSGRSPLVRP